MSENMLIKFFSVLIFAALVLESFAIPSPQQYVYQQSSSDAQAAAASNSNSETLIADNTYNPYPPQPRPVPYPYPEVYPLPSYPTPVPYPQIPPQNVVYQGSSSLSSAQAAASANSNQGLIGSFGPVDVNPYPIIQPRSVRNTGYFN